MIACSRAACTRSLICPRVCFIVAALRSGSGAYNETTNGNRPEGHMRSGQLGARWRPAFNSTSAAWIRAWAAADSPETGPAARADAHYRSRDNSRPRARAGVRALTNLVGPVVVVGPVGFEPT